MISRFIIFFAGGSLVLLAVFSAIKSFVIPRAIQDSLARFVFNTLRRVFALRLKHIPDYAGRDRLLAYYAPFGLLLMVPTWYVLILLGYTCLFWAVDPSSWYLAFRESGSSLFTLGFSTADGLGFLLLSFSEAGFGLMLVALLIAYLPTMYAAFSRREVAVTKLDVRAGNPPSPVEKLKQFHRIHGLERLQMEWEGWETWFAEIEESHTSLAALVFFRHLARSIHELLRRGRFWMPPLCANLWWTCRQNPRFPCASVQAFWLCATSPTFLGSLIIRIPNQATRFQSSARSSTPPVKS